MKHTNYKLVFTVETLPPAHSCYLHLKNETSGIAFWDPPPVSFKTVKARLLLVRFIKVTRIWPSIGVLRSSCEANLRNWFNQIAILMLFFLTALRATVSYVLHSWTLHRRLGKYNIERKEDKERGRGGERGRAEEGEKKSLKCLE